MRVEVWAEAFVDSGIAAVQVEARAWVYELAGVVAMVVLGDEAVVGALETDGVAYSLEEAVEVDRLAASMIGDYPACTLAASGDVAEVAVDMEAGKELVLALVAPVVAAFALAGYKTVDWEYTHSLAAVDALEGPS